MPRDTSAESRTENRSLPRISKLIEAGHDKWVKTLHEAAASVGMLQALVTSRHIPYRGKKESLANVPLSAVEENRVFRLGDLENPRALAISARVFKLNTVLRSKARSHFAGSPGVQQSSGGLNSQTPLPARGHPDRSEELRDLAGERRGHQRTLQELAEQGARLRQRSGQAQMDAEQARERLEQELASVIPVEEYSDDEDGERARGLFAERERLERLLSRVDEDLAGTSQELEAELARTEQRSRIITEMLQSVSIREDAICQQDSPGDRQSRRPPAGDRFSTPRQAPDLADMLDDYVFIKTKDVEPHLQSHIIRFDFEGGFIDEYGNIEDPSGKRSIDRSRLWEAMKASLARSPFAYMTIGGAASAAAGQPVIHKYDVSALYKAVMKLSTLTSQSHIAVLKKELTNFSVRKNEAFLDFMGRTMDLIERCGESGITPDYSLVNRAMYQAVITMKDMEREGNAYEDAANAIEVRDPAFARIHEYLFTRQMAVLSARAHTISQRDGIYHGRHATVAFSASSYAGTGTSTETSTDKDKAKEKAKAKKAKAKAAQATAKGKNDSKPRRGRDGRELPPTPGKCVHWWYNEPCDFGSDCRYDHKGPRKNQSRGSTSAGDGKNHCGVEGHKNHSKADCWKLHPEKMPAHIKKAIKAKAKLATSNSSDKPEGKYDAPKATASMAKSMSWDDGVDIPSASESDEEPRASRRQGTARMAVARPRGLLATFMLMTMLFLGCSAESLANDFIFEPWRLSRDTTTATFVNGTGTSWEDREPPETGWSWWYPSSLYEPRSPWNLIDTRGKSASFETISRSFRVGRAIQIASLAAANALMSYNPTLGQPGIFEAIVDSGCSHLITNQSTDFVPDSLREQETIIKLAEENSVMVATHTGTVRLCDQTGGVIAFEEALYVPEAQARLVSVGSLDDKGYYTVFGDNACEIRKDGRRRFRQKRKRSSDSLYTISLPLANTARASSYSAVQLPAETSDAAVSLLSNSYTGDLEKHEVLHNRLGHVCRKTLRQAYPKVKFPEKCLCPSCVNGKIHAFPFRSSGQNRVWNPGAYVHMDLAGPFVPTWGRKKYRALFVDDGSDVVFSVLLGKKHEQEAALERYRALIKTQFGVDVTHEKSDYGGSTPAKPRRTAPKLKGLPKNFLVPLLLSKTGNRSGRTGLWTKPLLLSCIARELRRICGVRQTNGLCSLTTMCHTRVTKSLANGSR